MDREADTAYAIAAVVCAFLGAAAGILTKRGMALTFAAVMLSRAPDWKCGLAWAVVAAIWYAIVSLVCRGRRAHITGSKTARQQDSMKACPDQAQLT